METWGKGKYLALVDGAETSCIKGSAYLVLSEEHEHRPRDYESEAYEVVRCLIEMGNTMVSHQGQERGRCLLGQNQSRKLAPNRELKKLYPREKKGW